jgi:RimJ/RimL family protein N-acetyltransferase
MGWVLDGDPDIARFTLLPSQLGPDFLDRWLGRYEDGWQDGTCAGFAVRAADDGRLIGFAAYVQLSLEAEEGEIGYVIDPAARGHGAATRSVELLTAWGFAALALQRIELHIAPGNAASTRVAERAGYRLDGVLRNTHFKEGLRTDTAIWSRLSTD